MHLENNFNMRRSCRDPYYIQVIFEYLLHIGLLDTATVFKEECDIKKLPVPQNNLAENDLKYMLLKYFDLGEEESFFQVFYASIPDLEQNSAETKKLAANLHLYFASVRYVKDNNHGRHSSDIKLDDINWNMSPNFLRLSTFLEKDCATLRNDPEFDPFFSLTFAPNPVNHHLFMQTFKASWSSNLRRSLQEYLWFHHPAFKVPDIVALIPSKAQSNIYCCVPHEDITKTSCEAGADQKKYFADGNQYDHIDLADQSHEFGAHESNFISENESEMQQTMHSHRNTALFIRRQNQKASTSLHIFTSNLETGLCQQNYDLLQKKFGQLHSDYHNLIGVASELTCALENCVRGQQVDLRDTLDNCVQIFPELFPQNHHHKNIKLRSSKKNISMDSYSCEWTLDIACIKRDLREGSVKTRLLLLQALRWAITKISNDRRKFIMNQFFKQDLLDLQGETLLASLLTPPGVVTPHPLQQSAARLLNTFASVQSGRTYLTQNSVIVNISTTVLKEHDKMFTDSTTKNMIVATLQKLSLRRSQRIAMIQSGIVEWVFHQISNTKFESSYSLEYGTALLMNLCLHQSAKELCIPIAHTVFAVLTSLLSSSIFQALPYVNGTLYSLISHPRLNEIAVEFGLSKVLEENLLKQANLDIRRQMEHVLKYHQSLLQSDCANTFPLPISEGELIDEDNEELDLLGEELDEHDPVRSINGELNGEDLLRTHYTLPNNANENNKDLSMTQTEVNMTQANESSLQLILRPTTPRHNQPISESITKTTRGSIISKFESTPDLNKKNNWHYRRSDIKQPQPLKRQDESQSARSQTLVFEPEEIGIHSKIEQSKQWQQNYSRVDRDKQHILSNEGQCKELPQISIHLAGTSDSADTDNNFNWDEDSEDVQVGRVPSKDTARQTTQTSGLWNVNDADMISTNIESRDTDAAFSSRPKIPRTPPHHQ